MQPTQKLYSARDPSLDPRSESVYNWSISASVSGLYSPPVTAVMISQLFLAHVCISVTSPHQVSYLKSGVGSGSTEGVLMEIGGLLMN